MIYIVCDMTILSCTRCLPHFHSLLTGCGGGCAAAMSVKLATMLITIGTVAGCRHWQTEHIPALPLHITIQFSRMCTLQAHNLQQLFSHISKLLKPCWLFVFQTQLASSCATCFTLATKKRLKIIIVLL